MKSWVQVSVFLALCLLAVLAAAFPLWVDVPQRGNANDPKSVYWVPPYIPPPTPTFVIPTPTPVPVNYIVSAVFSPGPQFSPPSLNIRVGDSVTWDSSFNSAHTVHLDDGAGNCSTDITGTAFPFTKVFTVTGFYHVHCDYHSPCGLGTCNGTCTGMTMTVMVN